MKIEYEDRDIVVIYKEAGLPVQTGRTSHRDIVSILKNHLAQSVSEAPDNKEPGKTGSREEPYLGIIHRLDQPVEGLLVFAKTPKSAASLSAQAASKEEMEKVYQAIVRLNGASYPLAIEGRKREVFLTDWIGRDYSSNAAYIASQEEKGAKRAELVFRTIWIRDGLALLEIRLHTGRHHQIRIQMAHAGMPLLGDRKYGGEQEVRETGPSKIPLCLCAVRLSFRHPVSKKRMSFCIEPSWLPLFSKDANMGIN